MRKSRYISDIKFAGLILLTAAFIYSCANRGQGPTGGLKDVDPPVPLSFSPANNSLNFKKKEILIEFDENISIEKATNNIVVSPPPKEDPDFLAIGKKLEIKLNDKLQDSTTYTIDFGEGIVDLNEKNILHNFRYAFSTGNTIDTLEISGTVLNAQSLDPEAGVLVGVYNNSDDSVFYHKPFLRIGKTDQKGHFAISNLKKGNYKVFALGDANRNYMFDSGEGIAFLDSLVTPFTRIEAMQDTIWRDSVTVDSIHHYMGTRFLPDDVIMSYFKEAKKRQYFVKSERKTPYMFSLFFNSTATELPKLRPLNCDWDKKHILVKNNTLDSLNYWITDSTVWKTDTLRMEMTYMKTDSLMKWVSQTDTINIITKGSADGKHSRNKKKQSESEKMKAYQLKTNINSVFEVYNPLSFSFDAPLEQYDLTKVKLMQKIDTVLKALPISWQQTDSTRMNYIIPYKWDPGKMYVLAVDSGAFTSIYHLSTGKLKSDFKIRSLDEYASIKMNVQPFDSKIVIQLLDTKDNVLQSKPALATGTVFNYLKPGDYFFRMFIDANGNGKWDTGELTPRKHPERVYYYPQKMTLIANWEFEESWDYLSVPLTKQKPLELDKNYKKPNDNSKQNNKSGSNNNNNSGTGNNSNTGNSKNNMNTNLRTLKR